MSPIELGVGFDDLEKLSRPPLIPDGTFEFQIAAVDDSPVQRSGRPQWRFRLQVINRPDLQNRSAFLYAQLPWVDPDTQQWDYTNCFTIVDLVNGTNMQVSEPQPDISGQTFYGIPKEMFIGKAGVMRIGHRQRTDDPELNDNTVRVVTKKKGGGTVV